MSQDKNNQMLAYMGVDKLHALGYKGNVIKIMILDNLSATSDDHEIVVRYSFLASAPNTQVVLRQNDDASWLEAIAEKYDIVHISMTAFSKELSKKFVDSGGIVTASTGNRSNSDTQNEHNQWEWVIDIGACYIDDNGVVQRDTVTKSNEYMDLTCFTPMRQRADGTWFTPIGTSFSSPFGSGAIACMLEHWKHIGYKYTPQSVKEYLIKHAVDILAVGKDNQSGYGYVKVGLMNTIKAQIGKNELVINGVVTPIGLKANGTPLPGARLVEGSTMVPMRAIGDAIESVVKDKTVISYKTDWDATTKTAIYFIDTK